MVVQILSCSWYNLSSIENSSEHLNRQGLLGIFLLSGCLFIKSKKTRSRKCTIIYTFLAFELRIKLNFILVYNIYVDAPLLS